MLVFTRKGGESIMIGDGIEVQVVSVGRGGVRLGIVAPSDVVVHRREIYELVRMANQSAVSPAGSSASTLASSLRQRLVPTPSPCADR